MVYWSVLYNAKNVHNQKKKIKKSKIKYLLFQIWVCKTLYLIKLKNYFLNLSIL